MANEISREENALPTIPFGMRAGIFSASMGIVGIADLAGHLGLPGIVLGTIGAVGVTKLSPVAIEFVKDRIDEMPEPVRKLIDRRRSRRAYAEEDCEDEDYENSEDYEEEYLEDEEEESEDMDEFMEEWRQIQEATPSIQRVSLDAIVEHTQRNSYWIYVGRNLSSDNHQVEVLNFCRQHIKIIGRSQMGKSSMAAALMDIITRTHDQRHVQLALLDLEHKTSRLFENLPHVAIWQSKKLLATNEEEVVEQLGYLLDMLKYRYTLSEAEVERLPLLLIYVEEFLDLKNEFKMRMKVLPKGEERDAAATAYAQLVLAINKIALRGLKVHMQFLLCAQVDYADEDFKEALAQFGIGFSFCVRPTAAQAAGFFANELLRENAQSKQKGQAVMEANGDDAIILAPEFNLRQRLIDFSPRPVFAQTSQSSAYRPMPGDQEEDPDLENRPFLGDPDEKNGAARKVLVFTKNGENRLPEPSDLGTEGGPEAEKEYRFTETEIVQFIALYKAIGNIAKVLAHMHKGAGYKKHAREIIQALGLRKDA